MANSDLTFDPSNFHNSPINNPYMPLAPGDTWVYGDPADPEALDTVKVLNQIKVIDGVECVAVSDIAKEGNKTVEKTRDYFAQDDQGNVWYFGEDTRTFQAGGVDFEGTWRAGRVPEGGTELARPGIIMLADPQVGDSYFEENALPVAHDGATVVSLNATAERSRNTPGDSSTPRTAISKAPSSKSSIRQVSASSGVKPAMAPMYCSRLPMAMGRLLKQWRALRVTLRRLRHSMHRSRSMRIWLISQLRMISHRG